MGITLKDIYEQRNMLRRGEEIARAAKQAEERERLRDTFAAAALTGLLVHANDGIDEETLDTPSDIAYTAYAMADAMLRERCRAAADCPLPDNAPNLDAAPAATADADSARTDKAAPRPGEGTGDTPTLTDSEREAVWFAIAYAQNAQHTSETTLRGLLERLGAANSGDDRRSGGGE